MYRLRLKRLVRSKRIVPSRDLFVLDDHGLVSFKGLFFGFAVERVRPADEDALPARPRPPARGLRQVSRQKSALFGAPTIVGLQLCSRSPPPSPASESITTSRLPSETCGAARPPRARYMVSAMSERWQRAPRQRLGNLTRRVFEDRMGCGDDGEYCHKCLACVHVYRSHRGGQQPVLLVLGKKEARFVE